LGAAGMVVGVAVIAGFGLKVPEDRLHHVVGSAFICAIAACAYFAMANGQGIHTFVDADGTQRIVYWARYLDWALTTPLLLIGLATVGMPRVRALHAREQNGRIGGLVGADLMMVATGLFAALSAKSHMRWSWFAISCVAFLVVLYLIVGPMRIDAISRGSDHSKLYTRLLTTLVLLWLIYPLVWIAGTEGVGTIGLGQEVAIFAVVDLLAKVGFGLMLVSGSANLRDKDEKHVSR
jgi:bacteriorhodopsin